MFCPMCGLDLQDSQGNFCPRCGAAIPRQSRQQKQLSQMLQGNPLRYSYLLDVIPAAGTDIGAVWQGVDKYVELIPEGDNISVLLAGFLFGHINKPDKAKMLSDWKRKDLPYQAILASAGSVRLGFYKDERRGQEWREQTVCKLTRYKKVDSQDALAYMYAGQICDAEDDDGTVWVSDGVENIGALPAAFVDRFNDEDCYGVFIEKIEEDSDGNFVPYVRIYW